MLFFPGWQDLQTHLGAEFPLEEGQDLRVFQVRHIDQVSIRAGDFENTVANLNTFVQVGGSSGKYLGDEDRARAFLPLEANP